MTERKQESGYSLIEVLVAVAIFAVIFIAALLIYDRSNKAFKAGVEAADVQQNTRVAFDKVVSDLRMAGFDYNRDGIPSGSSGGIAWQEQPDEQIEYAGKAAITIRANFNYEDAAAPCPSPLLSTTPPCDNGREPKYELSSGGVFPVVTTANKEIVTYALKSVNPSKNTDEIKFYADVPNRKSFKGAGGRKENLVTITGVDLSNENPPYTLYRFTVNEDAVTTTGTPVANNIRSMSFQYYEDPTGTIPLTDLTGTTPVAEAVDVTAADAYDPGTGATVPVRAVREKIQSVRLTLIGMNDAPDIGIVAPFETSTAPVFGYSSSTPKNFRQYRLETLIAPRNYGKQGMKEQETVAPGPPTITRVCIGYCGIAYLEWTPPTISPTQGSPESYQILVGTTSTSVTFPAAEPGLETSGYVALNDRTQSYYFAVKALNSYGSQNSTIVGPYFVKNATRPNPPDFTPYDLSSNPDGVTISGGGGASDPAPLESAIQLVWSAPTTNAAGSITCPLGGGTAADTNDQEIKHWIVERAENAAMTLNKKTFPDQALTPDPITHQVVFTDTVPNCVQFWYRVKLVEKCTSDLEQQSSDASLDNSSAFSIAVSGRAESPAQPAAPADLVIDQANSSCQTPDPADATSSAPCEVALSWPAVVTDTNGNRFQPLQYLISRSKKSASGPPSPPVPIYVDQSSAQSWNPEPGGTITFKDNTNGDPRKSGEVYVYSVQAVNTCPSATTPLSDPSPSRIYPCSFAGGTPSIDLSGAFDGDGLSSGSAWLVDDGTLNIATASPVERIAAVANPGGISIGDTGATSTSSASFGWPSGLTDGVVYTVTITIQDTGGCTFSTVRYVTQSATNCCLQPVIVEPGLVVLDGASKVMTVQLKNICSENLTLTTPSLTVTFDSNALSSSGGSQKLTDVYYPISLGSAPTSKDSIGANSLTPTDSSAPSGALKVLPPDTVVSTDDYRVKFEYGRTFSTNPLTNLCIHYTLASDPATTQTCRIFPAPSTTPGSCN